MFGSDHQHYIWAENELSTRHSSLLRWKRKIPCELCWGKPCTVDMQHVVTDWMRTAGRGCPTPAWASSLWLRFGISRGSTMHAHTKCNWRQARAECQAFKRRCPSFSPCRWLQVAQTTARFEGFIWDMSIRPGICRFLKFEKCNSLYFGRKGVPLCSVHYKTGNSEEQSLVALESIAKSDGSNKDWSSVPTRTGQEGSQERDSLWRPTEAVCWKRKHIVVRIPQSRNWNCNTRGCFTC